jgi:hypothetical protein
LSDAVADVDAASAWPDGSALPAQAGYAWERLEDQLAWHERRSSHHKDWFQRFKVLQIVFAAAIPVAAGTGASAWLMGSLGVMSAGPYREEARLDVLPAERLDRLVSQEHSAWSSAQAEAGISRGT